MLTRTQLMTEIAQATHNIEDFNIVMEVIYKRVRPRRHALETGRAVRAVFAHCHTVPAVGMGHRSHPSLPSMARTGARCTRR